MPVSLFSSPLYSGLFTDEELVRLLDDVSDVAHMVAFERALAIVQGRLGLIPAEAAETISNGLSNVRIDPAALAAGTVSAGVPVPALVAELRRTVGGDAGSWLHWGATSQDVIDTAMILQAKAALGLMAARLDKLIDVLQRQSDRHANRLLAGRTRSQIATPITLGYRIAQWAHPLIDAEMALPELRRTVLKVQFGGASGINSAIAPDGSSVSAALAKELDLHDSPSWHVNRTPALALSAWLQQLGAGLAKMAADLILLGRSDIGEVRSGTGGGSSTMPPKANPVQSEAILALQQISNAAQAGLAAAASPLEERDGARWPLEWQFLPQMLIATGAMLSHALALAETLEPNDDRLAETLADNPELMAEAASFLLAKKGVSRSDAKDFVAKAAVGPAPFLDALAKACPVEIDWKAELDPATAIAPAKEMSRRIFAKRHKN